MLESLFQPLASLLEIRLDQARYVLFLFINVPVAMAFRHVLHPSRVSLATRHTVSTLLGLLICIICFNWDALILVGMVTSSYVLLHLFPPSVVQRYTMIWVMSALSLAHVYRTFTDWGGNHLDFSTPMMILTQKLSLVGFALHDGMRGNRQPLNKDQEHHKLKSVPSVLEYFSYALNFHSILAGPCYTMREHLDYMEGSNLKPLDNPNQFARAKEHSKAPSPLYPVVRKFVLSLVVMAAYLSLSNYPLHLVVAPSLSFHYRVYIMMMVCWRIRFGFYFVWVLSDCINNAAGLGFSGYDTRGNAQWDLTTNASIPDMELAMSATTVANRWNATTSLWLRRVCYERITWQRNLLTFLLSALWHGFYPSYYLSLICLSILVQASKKMRRLFNPFFTGHGLALRWTYHLFTWVFAQSFINFGATTLQLLWLPEIWILWRSLYFIPVWTSLIVAIFLPSRASREREVTRAEVANGNISHKSVPNGTSGVAIGNVKLEKQD